MPIIGVTFMAESSDLQRPFDRVSMRSVSARAGVIAPEGMEKNL